MTDFPTTIHSPTSPTSADTLASVPHATQHQHHNDEIVAIETKIGTGASTPAAGKVLKSTGSGVSAWAQIDVTTDIASFTSANLRTLLSDETGTGSAVFATSPTLTTPQITTSINDTNGNEVFKTPAASNAVNEFTVSNSATGSPVSLAATGGDSNINLDIKPKGTGIIELLDGNGNEVVKTAAAVSSAINEVTFTNAAASNAPQMGATGGDTNIDLRLVPKGTGNIKRGTTGGAIDWWEELGRNTLGSAGDSLSVTSLPTRKYLRIIFSILPTGGTANGLIRFNNDSGNNYAYRVQTDGAADTTAASASSIPIGDTATAAPTKFASVDIINITAQEKLVYGFVVTANTAGAGNIPSRRSGVAKWANTSDAISRIDVVNTGTGDYNTGSELVVLGHD